ncbi:hypothetical protein DFH08DRAFT_954684 [Mycena albidolilacea]|uniref:Uncharacterized protein n=1 Tax=Mycena albidolilacea TaxID=1033008 RepID=A0AAD7ADC6_9AGAR|nr:hypothetical protein DFH08DRAFT_954684 [Mycena albidolilacea]
MKQEDAKPAIWNIITTGPPSTIIQDRPGSHTDAERRAHIHLVLQQRADLERIAGYDRMIAHISLLNQVNDGGKLQRAREHAQWVKSWQLCDRRGKREVPHKPLTEDDLYLDELLAAISIKSISIEAVLVSSRFLPAPPPPPPPPPMADHFPINLLIRVDANFRLKRHDRGERKVNVKKKKQMRSLLPRVYSRPPAATLPVKQTRPSRLQAPVPLSQLHTRPDDQASWEARWKDLEVMFLQGRAEEIIESDGKDSAVDEGEIDKARQWDKMMIQLVDAMPVADRREWLREQLLQENAMRWDTLTGSSTCKYVDF